MKVLQQHNETKALPPTLKMNELQPQRGFQCKNYANLTIACWK